jgi:hypothetical protein
MTRPAAPRETAPSSDKTPNYLSLDGGNVMNALINEVLAPFQGIKNVREAHGNRAAAELAVEICAEFPDPNTSVASATPSASSERSAPEKPAPTLRSPQMQTAATLDKAKNQSVGRSHPAAAGQENPYFAHLAMCTEGTPPPIQPPLGWVLSTATLTAFQSLLHQCDNDKELEQLEIALGKSDKSKQVRSR